jgi:hypothetical protein
MKKLLVILAAAAFVASAGMGLCGETNKVCNPHKCAEACKDKCKVKEGQKCPLAPKDKCADKK